MRVNGTWHKTSPTDCCPFCRTLTCSSNEEYFNLLNQRMKTNDAEAYHNMGCKYLDGLVGLPRDVDKAVELLLSAAELGSINAHSTLGLIYSGGRGLKSDEKKAIHHLEIAAMGGDDIARHNLGSYECKRGNTRRGMKHFMIAACAGVDMSLKVVRDGFMHGCVTKDEFEHSLRTHKESQDEIKSESREKAQKTGSSWKSPGTQLK